MTNSEAQIDPSIFDKENERNFSFTLGGTAQDYANAVNIISKYETDNSDEAKEGRIKELRADPGISEKINDIKSIIGESVMSRFVDEILVDSAVDPADRVAYKSALKLRTESTELLVGYVFGYQEYMEANLMNVFDGDESEALPTSWSATWSKLQSTLHPLGGTTLAEVADFFDNIIHFQYEDSYDHTDVFRGPVVAQDISARTFYEVMESHLTRSIVRRSDDWS